MLKSVRQFIEKNFLSPGDAGGAQRNREHLLQLATAALLVEMARADYQNSAIEMREIARLLAAHFDISKEEARTLLELAEQEADRVVSLHELTRLLHEHLSIAEKHAVIEMLWRVAYSDENLDKYEDYLVRKVGGLLYVSDSDVIRIRNQVRQIT